MRALINGLVLVSLFAVSINKASAAVISLDFNVQNTASPFQISPTMTGEEVAGVGTIFTGQSGPWNALLVGNDLFGNDGALVQTPLTSPLTTGPLLAGDGSATPVTFSFGTTATVSSPVSYSAFDGSGTGSTALREDMLLMASGQSSTWAIKGLVPGYSYNLVLFGQLYNNQAIYNPGVFTIFGNAPDLFDSQKDANFSNIIANAQGEITGTFGYISPTFGAWSGLQIEGTFIAPVPEPNVGLLTGMGLFGMMLRRRRMGAKQRKS